MASWHVPSPRRSTDVRRETRDAVVLYAAPSPEEHEDAFRFTQGQYLTFRALDRRRGGAPLLLDLRRRARAGAAGRHQEGRRAALFSTWANEALKPGQVLEAMPPMGNFYVPLDPASRKHYARLRRRQRHHARCSASSRRRWRPSRTAASRCSTATAPPARSCSARSWRS